MKRLKIILDYGEAPIWTKYYDEAKNKLMTGIETVDNDEKLWRLNDEIQDFYSSTCRWSLFCV